MIDGKIIDLRCRPPAAGFETMALYWDKDRVAQMAGCLDFRARPCKWGKIIRAKVGHELRPATRFDGLQAVLE